MLEKRALVLIAFVCLFFTACASSSEPEQRSRFKPPRYVMISGDGSFQVHCGMSRVFLPLLTVDEFRRADGTEKTRAEFCSEYGSDTQMRRRR